MMQYQPQQSWLWFSTSLFFSLPSKVYASVCVGSLNATNDCVADVNV